MARKNRRVLDTNVRVHAVICLLLVAAVVVIYGQTVGFGLVNYDDNIYVYERPQVLEGLTSRSVAWAFTTNCGANWHPLTWLSLMADARLSKCIYGPMGGGSAGSVGPGCKVFHATNVALHLANTLLLYFVLVFLVRRPWPSALVAMLFGVHPLHVESVAWVSERKDVLSTLFWMLAILAYLAYARAPSRRRMLGVSVLLVLGLAAKPMLVSLPLVLLMLDFWPLGRVDGSASLRVRGLVVEKLPLLAIAAGSCAVTFWAQRTGSAVAPLEQFPLVHRIANAATAYGWYLRKMLWPSELAAMYPYREHIPAVEIGLSVAFLVLATYLAVRAARHTALRWVTVGWLWYVVTLIPVIGLVQVGAQAMADRYSYVPLVGPFIIVAWFAAAVGERVIPDPKWRYGALSLAACAAILALLGASWKQAGYWRDSLTLCKRNLSVTADNAFAELHYAEALFDAGRPDEALPHNLAAVRLAPNWPKAEYGLGTLLGRTGKFPEAEAHLRRAAELAPSDLDVKNNLGMVLLCERKVNEAIEQFEAVLQADPNSQSARHNLELAHSMLRR